MIVNNKKKFLFIHIQKTAGSSITKNLHQVEGTLSLYNTHSMINMLDINYYQNYYKFCFVRNPWDRLYSWYKMMIKKQIHNSFSKYLLENSKNFSEFLELTDIIYETKDSEFNENFPYPKSLSFNQLDYITDDNGIILVDFIGRFELLEEDYNKIMEKIGINNIFLPHINKSTNGEYRHFYTDNDIEKVYNMYKRDIDYFGYKF
jgi:chondroitin 4-sulfotransferase 11